MLPAFDRACRFEDARVQMQDRGARFSGRDGFGRDLIRRDRQIG
jgi:hypothetical protein